MNEPHPDMLLGESFESRTKESLEMEARVFGVENRINIVEDPSQNEIADYLSRSKIFCALSHKEGSYIAVVESLMANTPVGMYANAMIGSKAYINEKLASFSTQMKSWRHKS